MQIHQARQGPIKRIGGRLHHLYSIDMGNKKKGVVSLQKMWAKMEGIRSREPSHAHRSRDVATSGKGVEAKKNVKMSRERHIVLNIPRSRNCDNHAASDRDDEVASLRTGRSYSSIWLISLLGRVLIAEGTCRPLLDGLALSFRFAVGP